MEEGEIIILIKPIMINEIKTEISLSISPKITPNDLITMINEKFVPIGNKLIFLFRGKKLNPNLPLKDQNINKSNLKLLMQKSKEEASNPEPQKGDKVEPTENEIEKARKYLLAKFTTETQKGVINSLLKSLPHISELSFEEIIQKATTFISSVAPNTSEQSYSMTFASSSYNISENNLTSIFAMGNGIHGQLGVNAYIKTDYPIRVNSLRNIRIIKIACGINHTIALTSTNTVYAWGRFFKPITKDKSLSTVGDYPSPILMESIANDCIVEISCGANHSMAINDKGDLYTWGEGVYGQLGHKVLNNEIYPRKVEIKNQIRVINAQGGAMHTMIVTDRGFILGWGNNEKQQLLMQKVKNVMDPCILPLYEYNNNFTIDEIRFNKENKESENAMNLNDLSTNVEDLMKVKLISCSMWYTAVTSQLFPLDIYILGNHQKQVLKITYFEKFNNDSIKQIEATSAFLYILMNTGSLYKIKVDSLIDDKSVSSGNEAIPVDIYSNIQIDKMACGYDYILSLTKSKTCYYTSFKTNKTLLMNSDIKTDIYDITSGNDFFFIITHLNMQYFSDLLFEKLSSKQDSCDITLKDSNGNNFKCHSFILCQYISLEKLKKENDIEEKYQIDIPDELISLFLQLIYTGNIDWIVNDNEEGMDEKLEKIEKFLEKYSNESEESKTLKGLVSLYKEKSKRKGEANELYSKEDVDLTYADLINKTYRIIMLSEAKIQINENMVDIVRRNSQESGSEVNNNEGNNEDNEESEGEDSNEEQNKNYFESMNKGVMIDSEGKNSNFSLNVESYKKYKEYIERSYMLYKSIEKQKQSLSELKLSYIQKNIKPLYQFTIISDKNTKSIINKELISLKSLFFFNFISSSQTALFDLSKTNLQLSIENFHSIISFISTGIAEVKPSNILDLLDLSIYFMTDNLTSSVEILLEEVINYTNVMCLLEIAKDYELTFLYRSCLIFLMINLAEIKNKGMMKKLQPKDKEQLKQLLLFNNKSL